MSAGNQEARWLAGFGWARERVRAGGLAGLLDDAAITTAPLGNSFTDGRLVALDEVFGNGVTNEIGCGCRAECFRRLLDSVAVARG